MIEIAIYLAPNCFTLAGPKDEMDKLIKAIREYIRSKK